MILRQAADRLRESLWFIPGLGLILAVVAAAIMLLISNQLLATQAHLPLIFGGGPEGARGMLQAIASSVVTVAGVVFSITVVALQLTSTQFSPRVLRNFMRDRPTQVTLAIFVATITYSLLVLRTIRSADADGTGAYVPGLAVTGALLLAFVSLAMLIYFIHHIGMRIQVSSIIESVTAETLGTIEGLHRELERLRDQGGGEVVAAPGAASAAVAADARTVPARRSGYLQYTDLGALLRLAHDEGLRLALLVPPGGWVQEHAPLFAVEPRDDELGDEARQQLDEHLCDNVGLGSQRSMRQDVGFGVQQLVDICVKALSPGINDPTTATQCIDRLTQVLVAVGRQDDPPVILTDADGVPRLAPRLPNFDALLRQGFEQVRHFGSGMPVVLRHLALSLATLKAALPSQRHGPIRREAERVASAAEALTGIDGREVAAPLAGIIDPR
ncbi:MAG TPA: DUF2254 domain-containing protein [Candidatus Limnocylindria bacterium]|nr:DUF2254 domain-containing protein [Candidatus Limnocylindria bacterium]